MSIESVVNKLNALNSNVLALGNRVREEEAGLQVALWVQLAMLVLPPLVAGLLLLIARGRGVGLETVLIGLAGLLHLPTTLVLVSGWGLWAAGEWGGRCCRRGERVEEDIELGEQAAAGSSSRCSVM